MADRHNDFIPFTDHRAIVGQLSHKSSLAMSVSGMSMFSLPSRRSAVIPHIKVPLKSEKDKYQTFQDQVDARIKAECISDRPVVDDDSFVRRYKDLGSIFKQVSEDVFGRKTPFVKKQDVVTNKQIKEIVGTLHAIGSAIQFEKSGHTAHISLKAAHVYFCAALDLGRDAGSTDTLLQFLVKKRRPLYKSLFAERSKEIIL